VRDAYDASVGTLMLVRPDGYVGLATNLGTIERVTEYWSDLYATGVAPGGRRIPETAGTEAHGEAVLRPTGG
jgi:hypothetical protein